MTAEVIYRWFAYWSLLGRFVTDTLISSEHPLVEIIVRIVDVNEELYFWARTFLFATIIIGPLSETPLGAWKRSPRPFGPEENALSWSEGDKLAPFWVPDISTNSTPSGFEVSWIQTAGCIFPCYATSRYTNDRHAIASLLKNQISSPEALWCCRVGWGRWIRSGILTQMTINNTIERFWTLMGLNYVKLTRN